MSRITLLTREDCALCEHAKKVIARIVADQPLEIQEIPLHSERGRALTATQPVPFAPGVVVDGELFGYGRLSERKLRRHLTRR